MLGSEVGSDILATERSEHFDLAASARKWQQLLSNFSECSPHCLQLARAGFHHAQSPAITSDGGHVR
jgi:hypothetical protein